MIELNKIVNDSLTKIEKEGFVEGIVERQIKQTLESIVDDLFRSYSDFGKDLKEHIKDNLNINLDRLGIEGYNGLVLAAIKEQLDAVITTQGIDKIKEATKEMLTNVKTEYKLSEIIELIRSEDDEGEKDSDDMITLFIEKSGSYCYIYIDGGEEDNRYDCAYQIDIDGEGKPYSVKLNSEEINPKKILGGLYGVDALLFKIYASGAKIILDKGTDPDNYDLRYEN